MTAGDFRAACGVVRWLIGVSDEAIHMKRSPNSSDAFDPDDSVGVWDLGVLPDRAGETATFDAGVVRLLAQQDAVQLLVQQDAVQPLPQQDAVQPLAQQDASLIHLDQFRADLRFRWHQWAR
jgi:hypothetical protein